MCAVQHQATRCFQLLVAGQLAHYKCVSFTNKCNLVGTDLINLMAEDISAHEMTGYSRKDLRCSLHNEIEIDCKDHSDCGYRR